MTTARPDTATLLLHQEWVRALARSLVRDASAADDIAQQTMLEAVTRAPADLREAKGWLVRVARNAARAFVRQEQRRTRREQVVARAAAAATAPDPAATVQRAAAHKRVVDTLFALPEPYHTVVLLRYFEDIDAHEIARRLDRPLATVRTQLQRGLAQMRERLDAEFGGDRDPWCALLAPLLPAKAAGVGVPVVTALGALLMTKWILSAAAVLLVLAFVFWPTHADPGAVPHTNAPDARADAVAATVPAASPDALRTPVAAEAPAPNDSPAAPVVDSTQLRRGRLVTLDGQPLASVVVASRDPGAPRRDGDRLVVGSTPMDLALPGNRAAIATAEGRRRIAFGFGVHAGNVLALLEGRQLERPRTTTDAQGRFEVERVSDRDELELEADGLMVYGEGRLPEENEPVFVAGPAVTVGGIVRDQRGAPLAGASVGLIYSLGSLPGICSRLRDASRFRSWNETTGDDGTFTLGRVPVVDGLWLGAQKRGFVAVRLATSSPTLHRPVDWTLRDDENRPTLLAGVVRHADGRPAARANIFFGHDGGLADVHGRFSIPLTSWNPNTLLVAFVRGHEPCVIEGLGARLRTDAAAGAALDLQLGGPMRTIAGRVVDAEGRPLAAYRVVLADARHIGNSDQTVEGWTGAQGEVHSDDQGRFELRGLASRPYTVRAIDPKTLLTLEAAAVPAGTTELELRAPANAFLEHLDGVVVDHRGVPVAGAALELHASLRVGERMSKTLPRREGVTSDADGRFRIERCPRRFVQVAAHGEGVAWKVTEVPADGGPLRIEVARRLRFRLTPLGGSAATAFEVHDPDGRVLHTTAVRPWGNPTFARTSLREPVSCYEVDDRAATLVLFADERELRREALTLRVGDVTEIAY